MRISDWSSDVCSSDLIFAFGRRIHQYPAAGAGLETEITSEAGVGRRRREVCVSPFQLLHRPVARSGAAGLAFNGGIHGFGKVIMRSAYRSEVTTSEPQSLKPISYAVISL